MYSAKMSYGQIATILTLIIAALFIFVIITLSLRRVTQRKAALDNAADGGALFLASNLGSLGNKLSQEYLQGSDSRCDFDLLYLLTIGVIIVTAVAGFFFPPLWAGTIAGISGAAATAALGIIGALIMTGSMVYNYAVREPKEFENFSIYFKQMTAEQQFIEAAIQFASFAVIDDPTQVQDIHDDNSNGSTDDKILRLTQKYYERLRGLPSLGTLIKEFVAQLQYPKPAEQLTRADKGLVVVEENEDWEVTKAWAPDPPNPTAYFTDWLNNKLIPLLKLLDDAGYTTTFSAADVNQLKSEIEDFEKWALVILKQSPDQRLAGFNQWYNQLIRPSGEDPNDFYWQDRLIKWQAQVGAWINELNGIQAEVQACVDKCCSREWGCWGDDCEGGSCCAEECVHLQQPSGTKYVLLAYNREGASSVYDSGVGILPSNRNWMFAQEDVGDTPAGEGDEPPPDEPPPDEPPPCTPVCVGWQGCCGPERCCGDLCEDANCPPKVNCDTHKGSRNCCQSGHLVQNNCDPETSGIVQALKHLEPFKEDLDGFINYLPVFIKGVNDFNKEFGQSLKFSYDWPDSLGYHKVAVAVKNLPLDKDGRFKGPYLQPGRNWWKLGAEKCIWLKNYEGDFKFVVSRYDKEEAKGLKGILELLNWNKTITSETQAHYDFRKENIKIKRVK